MEKIFNLVLLIDDDVNDIWFHKRIIQKTMFATEVIAFENGKKALQFISKIENPKPDIIFLDLYMPKMDGWEFIEEYQKLPEKITAAIQLFILTSSVSATNQTKSLSYKWIKAFYEKPITKEMLQNITNLSQM
tara:strand:- start:1654 stop:2052 length:399 start_codon:yes stop_codon:yes gene_type:complete